MVIYDKDVEMADWLGVHRFIWSNMFHPLKCAEGLTRVGGATIIPVLVVEFTKIRMINWFGGSQRGVPGMR